MLPFFDQDHENLRARVRAWVKEKLFRPRNQNETTEQSAVQLVKQLAAAGLLQYTVTGEFGGIRQAVSARDLCIVREELARGEALADAMFAMQALGSYPVALAGSKAQKQSYLTRVSKGSAIAAFAMTEAEAGSDAGSMQTRARRCDHGFSIKGTKCFISNAGIADFYIVFASTQPDKKDQGISAFVVDAANSGLSVKEKTALLS
ncbi:MAG: acyl-CoA dehydrogenase family protein, partial [bacterium]